MTWASRRSRWAPLLEKAALGVATMRVPAALQHQPFPCMKTQNGNLLLLLIVTLLAQ